MPSLDPPPQKEAQLTGTLNQPRNIHGFNGGGGGGGVVPGAKGGAGLLLLGNQAAE